MRTSLKDLNEYLFEALDRISNDALQGDALEAEIQRTDAITKVGRTIIDNAEVALRAQKHMDEYGHNVNIVAPMITGGIDGKTV